MSWGIYATGTPEKVIEYVQNSKGYGDSSQIEIAKAIIVAEIQAQEWPTAGGTNVNAVKVEASGHHDNSGARQLSIKVERFHFQR